MTCSPGSMFINVTLYVLNLPIAGAPIQQDAFWSSGDQERLHWVAEGRLLGETASGSYTITIDGCGQQTVAWNAVRQ